MSNDQGTAQGRHKITRMHGMPETGKNTRRHIVENGAQIPRQKQVQAAQAPGRRTREAGGLT